MLIQFTVGNFKSFREQTTFSMVAAPLRSDPPHLDTDNVIPVNKNLSLLRSAAVYGANASGKSNLGAALRFMREQVLSSFGGAQDASHVPVEPFLFRMKNRDEPSYFEVVAHVNDTQYRYGFEASTAEIVSEWLFYTPKTKETVLFLRDGEKITVGKAFLEGKDLEARTRRDTLFLSLVAGLNGEVALRIQNWFENFTITTGLQDEHRELTMRCLRDKNLHRQVAAMFSEMDLGFNNLRALQPVSADILPKEWPEDARQRTAAEASRIILTIHPVYDDQGNIVGQQNLTLDIHESHGTRKLVALAGLLLTVLASGHCVFIDELDARLHPLITRKIVELFHSPRNASGAQLIFATHDTNLLDRALFRRDQIWFTEKDRQGATHLYSLADYSPRNDAAFEKNYLAGRYGAIPYLGDISRLPLADAGPEEKAGEEQTAEMAHAG